MASGSKGARLVHGIPALFVCGLLALLIVRPKDLIVLSILTLNRNSPFVCRSICFEPPCAQAGRHMTDLCKIELLLDLTLLGIFNHILCHYLVFYF